MFNVTVRAMSKNEEDMVAATWNRSDEKQELDKRQEKLKIAIALKGGSYSPIEHNTGKLW